MPETNLEGGAWIKGKETHFYQKLASLRPNERVEGKETQWPYRCRRGEALLPISIGI